MSRTEKFLPFILSAVGPGIAAITNSLNPDGEWYIIVLKYLQGSLTVLFLWYFNKWLLNTDNTFKRLLGLTPFTILLNLGLIALLVFSDNITLNKDLRADMGLPGLVIRLSLLTLIINVILRVFKTQKERTNLELQNLSLQAENLKFQIDTLKQQINPHFLFNSLNTLLDLIEEDTKAAVKYVRNFSNLYRVVLQSTKMDFISVQDELNFLNDYWSLLKVRFRDAIDLKLDVNDEKLDRLIPPLCLQLLIENAVKHNEATSKKPLVIQIYEENEWLIVKNQIIPVTYPVVGEQVGLKNLQERFTLLNQPIQYGDENGFFIVKIPLKNPE